MKQVVSVEARHWSEYYKEDKRYHHNNIRPTSYGRYAKVHARRVERRAAKQMDWSE